VGLIFATGLRKDAPARGRVDGAEGSVYLLSGESRRRAQAGAALLPGEGIETVGEESRARVTAPDGTRIDLGADTEIARVLEGQVELRGGSAAFRRAGTLVVSTPHGSLTASGAAFRVSVDRAFRRGRTKVEADEGDVHVRRSADGREASVPAGHSAVVPPAGEVAVRALPIDEVALTPGRARIGGDRWRVVRDDQATGGAALELSAPAGSSVLEFTFAAEAQKEYAIAIRARSIGGSRPALVLEPVDGAFLSRCASWEAAAFHAFAFEAGGLDEEYRWIEEGHSFVGRTGPGDADRLPDLTRAAVRFHRSGPQTLRLRAPGGSLRVDAIRLTATRRTGSELSVR
jgi:hypothetical protein